MSINLQEYLPKNIYKDVFEMEQLLELENWLIENLQWIVENERKNQFLQTASTQGVNKWETILNILPKSTDNLEERKFRVFVRINDRPPYTLRAIEQKLATLCGENGYFISLKGYDLTVKVALAAKSSMDAVDELLHRIVPANIVIDLDLKYNQYSVIGRYTHGELRSYSHGFLRNEVLS